MHIVIASLDFYLLKVLRFLMCIVQIHIELLIFSYILQMNDDLDRYLLFDIRTEKQAIHPLASLLSQNVCISR